MYGLARGLFSLLLSLLLSLLFLVLPTTESRAQKRAIGAPCKADLECTSGSACVAGSCQRPGWVVVSPGEFTIGSPADEPGRMADEGRYRVRIPTRLLVSRKEVTIAEWKALMGGSPARFDACGPSCPVERVSWYDAVSYANALSQREGLEVCYELKRCRGKAGGGCPPKKGFCVGDYRCKEVTATGPACKGYRLPSEAEWEYLARAGTSAATYSGPLSAAGERTSKALDALAWHGGNSGVSYARGQPCADWKERGHDAELCGTHPAGKRKANPWGIFDVLGNVWEWTEDLYHKDRKAAPRDGRATITPPSAFRTFRGCSWVSRASLCRVAARNRQIAAYRSFGVGFRLVRTLPPGG